MNQATKLFLAIALTCLSIQNTYANKSIFGEDDVFDYFELSNGFYDKLSNLTVVVASTNRLVTNGDYVNFKDEGQTLQTAKNMCREERFSQQRQQGFCSGFFVSNDVIATAGHCLKTKEDCANTSFVTGFKIDPSNQKPVTSYHKNNVYKCERILSHKFTDFGSGYEDYALVLIDRAATNNEFRNLRTEYSLDTLEELMVIGHPLGLPQKIARNGFPTSMYNDSVMNTTLDTFGGNSGSPVFDEKNGDIIGILVAGGKKGNLELDSENGCYRWVRCEKPEQNARCNPNMIQLLSKVPEIQNGVINSFRIFNLLDSRKLAEAKELLKKKYDINTLSRNKYNFLMLAIWNQDLDLVKRFLAEGNRLNDRDVWGRNAFIFTAVSGWIEGAKFLIEKRAPMNTVDIHGDTALHTAAERGHTKLAQFLLEEGVNFRIADQSGNTALHDAIANKKEDTAIAIAQFPGMEINRTSNSIGSPLKSALTNKMYRLVKVLKDLGATGDISSTVATQFISSANDGDMDKVKLLISLGADVNAVDYAGETAMLKAWKNGHKAIAGYLYSQGTGLFKQNKNKESIWTIMKGNRFQVTDLTWLNEYGYFEVEDHLWNTVAEFGLLSSVKYLISEGYDVNKLDKHGENALIEIVTHANYGMEEREKLRFLLKNNANPNLAKYSTSENKTGGWTALHFAVSRENVDAVEDLFRGCANKEIKDDAGNTAYDVAKARGAKKLFKKIFKNSKKLCKEGF